MSVSTRNQDNSVRRGLRARLAALWRRRNLDSGTSAGWIGVDLDGTLAEYDLWLGPEFIGEPVPAMLDRVRQWVSEGIEVRVVTARAGHPRHRRFVEIWLQRHGLGQLSVTDKKDYAMIELWDDRCVAVQTNRGEPLHAVPPRRQTKPP